jgi:hypothetical protein
VEVPAVNIRRVEKSYRIALPHSMLEEAGWVPADQRCRGWLLIGSPGRCRLLSVSEVDSDPDLQSIRARIADVHTESGNSLLEFQDEAAVALAFRLVAVEIAPPKPAWRLVLPKPVAAIMHLRPGESDVAVLVIQGHIEIWTIEALRAAVDIPLNEVL